MKNCEDIKNQVENLLEESKISYEYIDLEDDDINYLINFNAKGRFKYLGCISGVLYFCNKNFSMNFLVFNIYACEDDDMKIYEFINDVNSRLLYGNFVVEYDSIEKEKYIVYKSLINCGKNYCGLNKELLQQQVNAFFAGLEKLFLLLKNRE